MPYRDAAKPIVIKLAALTSTGPMREVNEDCFGITLPGERLVIGPPLESAFIERSRLASDVCVLGAYDGCGGVAPGDIASRMLARGMHEAFKHGWPGTTRDETAVAQALAAAGALVFERATSDRSARGMGSTATVAAIAENRLLLAHVGDTRAYLWRSAELRQLTEDDTLLNELLRKNELTADGARDFPHNNVITRALGVMPQVVVSSYSLRLEPGDRVLLCTDGLTSMIDDGEIARVLARHADPARACDALNAAAEHGGGHDNVTVVLAEIDY